MGFISFGGAIFLLKPPQANGGGLNVPACCTTKTVQRKAPVELQDEHGCKLTLLFLFIFIIIITYRLRAAALTNLSNNVLCLQPSSFLEACQCTLIRLFSDVIVGQCSAVDIELKRIYF